MTCCMTCEKSPTAVATIAPTFLFPFSSFCLPVGSGEFPE